MKKSTVTIFGREPARWIGLILTLVVAIGRVLVGDELISQDQADAVANALQKFADLVLIFVPLIGAEAIRTQVTPVAAPVLAPDTVVTPTDGGGKTVVK